MGFGDTCVLTKSDKGTHIRGEQGAGSERTSRSLKARHLQNGGSGPDGEASGPAGAACALRSGNQARPGRQGASLSGGEGQGAVPQGGYPYLAV